MRKKNISKSASQLPLYSKAQFIASRRYQDRVDLLSVLLTNGEKYTIEMVDQKIEEFMKGRVN